MSQPHPVFPITPEYHSKSEPHYLLSKAKGNYQVERTERVKTGEHHLGHPGGELVHRNFDLENVISFLDTLKHECDALRVLADSGNIVLSSNLVPWMFTLKSPPSLLIQNP